jgi:hypothetical protein
VIFLILWEGAWMLGLAWAAGATAADADWSGGLWLLVLSVAVGLYVAQSVEQYRQERRKRDR